MHLPSFFSSSICPSVCLSVCPSIGPSVCLSVSLSICSFLFLFIPLSFCLSVCWSVHLLVRPSVGPPVRPTVCPSVRPLGYSSLHPSVWITDCLISYLISISYHCFSSIPLYLFSFLCFLSFFLFISGSHSLFPSLFLFLSF
jgi:hypothetical protein